MGCWERAELSSGCVTNQHSLEVSSDNGEQGSIGPIASDIESLSRFNHPWLFILNHTFVGNIKFLHIRNKKCSASNRRPSTLISIFSSSSPPHSALDDGDGPQLDGLLADPSVVTRVNDVRHILVGLRGLHREQKEDP